MRGKITKLIALPILAMMILSSMPAIVPVRAQTTVYLHVDGFSASYTGWTAVGTSPYLNAPDDGNYVEGTTDAALMGWFTFEDIDPSYFASAVVDEVWLEGYTSGPYNTGLDFDAYNTAFDWLGSLYANGAPQWVTPRWVGSDPTSELMPALKSEGGLNAFQMLLYLYDPDHYGGAGNIVDALRLRVTFKEIPPPPIPILAVSPEVNTAGVSETFTIDLVIKPPPFTSVVDLYGIEFKLAYDPNVVTALGVSTGSFWVGGVVEWINVVDPSGFVWYSVTRPLGSPTGLSGSGTIASIDFSVVGVGVSGLDLYDVLAGNRFAVPIALILENGVFANAQDITVNLRTAYVGSRHVSPPEAQTLSAEIKNKGAARTTARVQYAISDELGNPVATLLSAPISLAPGQATKDTMVSWTGYASLTQYSVTVTVLYRDPSGGWSVGLKGTDNSHWDSMTVSFVVGA